MRAAARPTTSTDGECRRQRPARQARRSAAGRRPRQHRDSAHATLASSTRVCRRNTSAPRAALERDAEPLHPPVQRLARQPERLGGPRHAAAVRRAAPPRAHRARTCPRRRTRTRGRQCRRVASARPRSSGVISSPGRPGGRAAAGSRARARCPARRARAAPARPRRRASASGPDLDSSWRASGRMSSGRSRSGGTRARSR